MRTQIKASILLLAFLAVVTLGCGGNKQENKPAASPPPQPAQQQETVTMNATVSQFIDIYNKEVKRRYSEKSILGTEKPIRPGTTMYDVPDGKGSHLVINFNPSNNKITSVTFTVQGDTGEKFDRKALNAWSAAIISATIPGVSNEAITEIRGKLLAETPVTKNNIYYLSQNMEKGSPFFQIIARAQ